MTQAATPLTITASAGTGGTISPSGSVSVAYGTDQTFTIAHDAGYIVSSFSIDGSPITFPASDFDYTFPNVTTNHTISVSFTEGVSPLGYFGKIYQNPLQVPPGTGFDQSGKAFTSNSRVTLHFRDPFGNELTDSLLTDAYGDFATYNYCDINLPLGSYSWKVVDDTTGRYSETIVYRIGDTNTANTIPISINSANIPSDLPPQPKIEVFGTLHPLGTFYPDKESFVIVHGWNGNSDGWVTDMGNDIKFYSHKIQLDFATIARESGRVGF